MQLKNFALLTLISAAIAAPASDAQIQSPNKGDKFGLVAIHSGNKVHNQGIIATHGRIQVGGKQDASCDKKSKFATFYIQDGAAFLYAESATPQQLWVDRSGMGQGIVGYTTGAQPLPRNAERKKFDINKNGNLVFDNKRPMACPTGNKDGSYSLWFTDAKHPGGNEKCVGVGLRAIKADKPIGCLYTSD